MELLQNISLDFGKDTEPITVFAKQGDAKTRYIEISPLNKGQKYPLEAGITARLHITKPNGKIVLSDAAIMPETGTIRAELTKQALAVAGIASAEIGLYKGNALLSSQVFYIRIEKRAYSDNALESSDEYKSLVDVLAEVDPAVKKAEDAASAATTAAETATTKAAEAATAATNADKAAEKANTSAPAADKATSAAESAATAAITATAAANQAVKDAQAVINQSIDLAFYINENDGGLDIRVMKEGY